MQSVLLSVLNMSMTASYVIAAIVLVRLLLKKAPRAASYALWAVAGFRLVFPFTVESMFSLIPFKAAPIPQDIAYQAVPRIDSGIGAVDAAVSGLLPAAAPQNSVNPMQTVLAVGAAVWLIGIAALLVYSAVSLLLLKRSLKNASPAVGNIFEADNLKTPFVIGFFRPRIYIPAGLGEEERRYVLLHEQTHIRRFDHVMKFAAFLILCVHWFNPLAWLAFVLMSADMEHSCDERVLRELGGGIKKAYSASLLSLAAGRRVINASPLAFGEGGVKARIKNVLNFKKPSRVIIVAAAVLAAALTVGFALNRIQSAPPAKMQMVYEEDPAYALKRMRLVWDDTVYYVTPMESPKRGAEIGYTADELSTWRIFELKGHGRDYLLAVESEDVWRVMSVYPPEEPWRQYILENATEKMKMERLLSVSLYSDGTAVLATPLISSYSLPECAYTIEDGRLLISAKLETESEEGFFGLSDDEVIVTFDMPDDNTLVFRSAAVVLFADDGARYVRAAGAASLYEANEWLSYGPGGQMDWDDSAYLEIPEYPGVVFHWTPGEVTVQDAQGERTIMNGMPIWNVYLVDLNGDNRPELCATVSFGSGIIDTHVLVYDCADGSLYSLWDRMVFDYALSLADGSLIVTQSSYNGDKLAEGSLALIGGELVTFGLDRERPENG